MFHSTGAVQKYFAGIPEWFSYITDLGAAGVHIFFVISGFIMVHTSFSSDGTPVSPARFLKRRFIRIFPIYWIYALLYLLFHNTFGSGFNLSIKEAVYSLLLLPGYSSLIIGPGWTLSYELYFYTCFAVALMFRLSLCLVSLSLLFVTSIALRIYAGLSDEAHVFTNPLLIEFLLGAWAAYFRARFSFTGAAIANVLTLLALVTFLGGVFAGYHVFPSAITWGVPSALLVAGLVLSERAGHIPAMVSKLARLGDSSYSLYLLHILLIDAALIPLARSGLMGSLSFLLIPLCFALTVLCITMAHLAYEFLERPLLTRLQTLSRAKAA